MKGSESEGGGLEGCRHDSGKTVGRHCWPRDYPATDREGRYFGGRISVEMTLPA